MKFQKFLDDNLPTPLEETQKEITELKRLIKIYIKNPQEYLLFRKKKYIRESDERVLALRK